jgi:hypothetical protein
MQLAVLQAMNAVAGLAGRFQELASQKLLRMLRVQRSCGSDDVDIVLKCDTPSDQV